MKRFLSLLIVLLIFGAEHAHAKKLFYPIQMVAAMADVIVTGQIRSVGHNSYIFETDQTIKGIPSRNLLVKQFREWTCDFRWKKVEVGQNLMLFLTKGNADTFNIINGSTGEVFIVDNLLRMNIGTVESPKLEEAITSFRNFIRCYILVSARPIQFKQIATGRDISVFRQLNQLSEALFEPMKKFRVVI